MYAKNPINRVTKTARIATAKRVAANRAGNRFMAVAMSLPTAEFLSPGHSPSQRLAHEPKPGSRQEEDTAMRYQPNAAIPTGPVGRFSGPAVRRLATRPIPSWSHGSRTWLGCDCQSPDLATNPTDRKRDSWQLATTATRMSRPTATAAK